MWQASYKACHEKETVLTMIKQNSSLIILKKSSLKDRAGKALSHSKQILHPILSLEDEKRTDGSWRSYTTGVQRELLCTFFGRIEEKYPSFGGLSQNPN